LFKITEIQGGDSEFRATTESREAKKAHVVTFTFEPKRAGERSLSFSVLTDIAGSSLSIPVRGRAALPEE
jgi:hypothetical protein